MDIEWKFFEGLSLLHPAIVKPLLAAFIRECRWKHNAMREYRLELESSDSIQPSEIPKQASFSGWMLNEREVQIAFGPQGSWNNHKPRKPHPR